MPRPKPGTRLFLLCVCSGVDPFAVEVRQLRPEFWLTDVVISGGQVNGDKADLRVAGQMTVPRLEPTGEIIEATSYPVRGTVSLVRSARGWRLSDSQLDRTLE